MKWGEKNKDSSMILALVLFIGAAGLVFLYLSAGSPKPTQKLQKSAQYEKAVNRHLMMTNDRIQLEQQKMQLESARLLDKGAKAKNPQSAYQNENILDLNHDQRALEMARELGRGEREERLETPDDVIQREVLNQQQMHEYSEEYKREYARQFVENARRGGYKVILSEDLSRVISVTPIRRQDGMSLYGNGAGGVSEPLQ